MTELDKFLKGMKVITNGGKTMKQYNILISHSWKHDGSEYDTLTQWLDNSSLKWNDFSTPEDNPISTTGTDKDLQTKLDNKIKESTLLLVMAGASSSYSKWIKKELDMAKSYGKPIIGISPWGKHQESQVVKNAADEMVGWNSSSVIEAIKRLSK